MNKITMKNYQEIINSLNNQSVFDLNLQFIEEESKYNRSYYWFSPEPMQWVKLYREVVEEEKEEWYWVVDSVYLYIGVTYYFQTEIEFCGIEYDEMISYEETNT